MGHYPTKIATCCYCGTRAALVLRGETRHELSCSACGAPLHDLKMLRTDRAEGPSRTPTRRSGARKGRPVAAVSSGRGKPPKSPKSKRKKRKPLWARALGEAFDAIEDIFD